MTDSEILTWIETELRAAVGTGPFHHVARHVHNGTPLREAVAQQIARPVPVATKPRRKASPPPKPYFTPHACHRYYQRLGVHPTLEVQGEIAELVRAGKGQVLEKTQKGWCVKCRVELRGVPLYVIYDYRKQQITTLWTEAEHRGPGLR